MVFVAMPVPVVVPVRPAQDHGTRDVHDQAQAGDRQRFAVLDGLRG